jgi:hypothetical protein
VCEVEKVVGPNPCLGRGEDWIEINPIIKLDVAMAIDGM